MKAFIALPILLSALGAASAKSPDCAGKDSWPENTSASYLKNAGLIDPAQLDWGKSNAKELTSERIGSDLYRQVHLITFQRKDGSSVQAITIGDASSEECSMSGITVFVVSKTLGEPLAVRKSH